jgi:hypothetical protein
MDDNFIDQWRAKVRHDIDTVGQSLVGVGDEDIIPFTYTVGMHEAGYPELLIIGGTGPRWGATLNAFCDQVHKQKRAYRNNELVSLGGPFPAKIVDAGELAKRDYTCGVSGFYDHIDYLVQQILLSDAAGRYPDDPRCAKPYSDIPVLKRLLM